MSNPQTDATARKGAPRSRRRDNPSFAFALVPAVVVAGVVLIIGVVAAPPRYIAHASFVVDRNSLSPAPNNEGPAMTSHGRSVIDVAEITSLPDSEPGISEVLDHAADFSGSHMDKAAVISKLQKHLQVTFADQTDRGALFIIETRDDDPGAAQAAANWVLQGTVSKLKADANKTGMGLAALRSRAGTGFDTPSNLGEVVFTDPIKAIEEARVEKRGAGYRLSLLLVAVILGGLAAGFGWLQRQIELMVMALKATAGSTPRQAAAGYASSGRRQRQVPQRPILLRPLPSHCPIDDLQGADDLSHQGKGV